MNLANLPGSRMLFVNALPSGAVTLKLSEAAAAAVADHAMFSLVAVSR